MRCKVRAFAVLLAVCIACSVPWVCAIGSEEAAAAVSNADVALRPAFVAVSDAESSGANVSGLMGRLNEAGVALTGARVAFSAGNYSDAVSRADQCKNMADGIASDAGVLKNDAVAQASGWWITVSYSVVGSVVFAVVLLLVWRRFKRFHADRLLGSRPEVVG